MVKNIYLIFQILVLDITKNPITLAAPGVRIYSMKNKSHDQYIDKQGTSMATPVVAGLVALVKGINNDLTASEIVNLIKETSDSSTDSDIGNTNYTGADESMQKN